MNPGVMKMEQVIRAFAKENREVREENDSLTRELTGAQQLTSFLMQRFAPDGLTVPMKELASVGGSLRVTFNEDETVTVVAVTPEQIEQAMRELEENGNKSAVSDGEVALVDATGAPIERGEGAGDGSEGSGDNAGVGSPDLL